MHCARTTGMHATKRNREAETEKVREKPEITTQSAADPAKPDSTPAHKMRPEDTAARDATAVDPDDKAQIDSLQAAGYERVLDDSDVDQTCWAGLPGCKPTRKRCKNCSEYVCEYCTGAVVKGAAEGVPRAYVCCLHPECMKAVECMLESFPGFATLTYNGLDVERKHPSVIAAASQESYATRKVKASRAKTFVWETERVASSADEDLIELCHMLHIFDPSVDPMLMTESSISSQLQRAYEIFTASTLHDFQIDAAHGTHLSGFGYNHPTPGREKHNGYHALETQLERLYNFFVQYQKHQDDGTVGSFEETGGIGLLSEVTRSQLAAMAPGLKHWITHIRTSTTLNSPRTESTSSATPTEAHPSKTHGSDHVTARHGSACSH